MLQNQSDSDSMIIPCSDLEFSDLLKCKSYSKISAIAESDSLIQAVEIRSYSHSETSTLMLGNNEAIIDESLAGVLDIEYGSYLTISIPRVMKNRLTLGNAPSFRVIGFHTEKEMGANPLEIVVNSETFKNLDSENKKENHTILWLKDPFDIESMTTKIEPIIRPYQYEITDWIEKNENLFRAILIEKAVMIGLLFLVVLIAIFNVMVMISMTIESKKGDIAILKSLGYNQRDVTQIFLIQGCIANFIGILLGLILSLAVLFNLNHIEEISRNIFNFEIFHQAYISLIRCLMS
jgi:ABC-type transport system, involved in lipoprotein release, permease component